MDVAPKDRFQSCIAHMMGTLGEIINDANLRGYRGVDGEILKKVQSYIDQYDAHQLIISYIQYSYQFWAQMADRDENFFLANCGAIFGFLPIDKSDQAFFTQVISNLISARDGNGNSYITDDDKDYLWDSFATLNRISVNFMIADSTLIREIDMLMNIQRMKEENESGTKIPRVTIDIQAAQKIWLS